MDRRRGSQVPCRSKRQSQVVAVEPERMETTATSDKSIGLSVLFGVLGLAGALGMFLTAISHDQLGSGIAFAGAMIAGAMAIGAVHAYG